MIFQQKIIAREILDKLKVIDPFCILAGGAPRDWRFGRVANDLDFYFVSTASTIKANREQLETVLGHPVGLMMERGRGHEDAQYSSMKSLKRIWEFEYKDIPVQLMQMNFPGDQFKIVDQMDVSICKAWWVGDKIHLHQDFKLTLTSNIMFLKEGCYWDDKHAVKMRERFPKFGMGTKESASNSLIRKTLSGVV